MSDSTKIKMLVGAGAVGVASALSGLYYWYRRAQQTPPKKWREIGTLEEIYLFPIKSCGAIKLDAANCEILGINEKGIKDRALMLIDKNGKAVTARTYPKMLKIQPHVLPNGCLIITAPEMPDIEFDYQKVGLENETDIKINLWDTDVFAMPCGKKFDEWFSKYILGLDEGLRLVYYPFPVPTREIVEPIFNNGIFQRSDTGTFADVSSYMIMHTGSVNELNTRLVNQVHPLHFRGNFVIKTNQKPYAEDDWNWIKIGNDTVFRALAPCYRCIFPNINPFTAERDPTGEPLKTLKKFRVWGKSNAPRMGLQIALRLSEGQINGQVNKGDSIYVEDNTDP